MARRGRKPTGTNLVEHLEGSERAKTRLKAILETLPAQRSIPEVCEDLGIQRVDVPPRAERGAADGIGPSGAASSRAASRKQSPPEELQSGGNGRREPALATGVEGGRGPPRVGREAAAVGQVRKRIRPAKKGKKRRLGSGSGIRQRLQHRKNRPRP